MVFKCQEDSFLREFSSRVLHCEEAELPAPSGKGANLRGYSVVCEDTILFPEGGGQPCDFGYLAGKRVLNVVRKGDTAIHFVESAEPLNPGQEVRQEIDWERRKDHMQQHSGQHLVTALFEREYNMETKAWWLGSDTTYIELGAKDVSQEQLDCVERMANNLIASAKNVSVSVFKSVDNLSDEVTRATRGLPKDHVGPIRVVTIEDVEGNMCCGTHVTNLSQLQVIKMLNVEKTKNKLLVHFLVGDRVVKKLATSFKRELEMNIVLNGGPSSHLELLGKLQTNLKKYQRQVKSLLKDIAINEGEKLKSASLKPKYFFIHRTDGSDAEFLTNFLRAAGDLPDTFVFATSVDDSSNGQMILQGNPEVIGKLGGEVCELLGGKGNGKGSTYRAKITNTKNIKKAEALIVQHFGEIEQ
ncbi:alanyl-tRNA editing protein Aarsd1-A [Phlebotomus argentipes]|uniref:alanyl-tRNA editing protein Aarsd1-A n=1 Tax=Phlebotomus argentipes TaxID=94469 RepID=UPI0028935C74|nr:alanyl-tRNA editing protein Aarsd1-A [Phlebotomus argentipes]